MIFDGDYQPPTRADVMTAARHVAAQPGHCLSCRCGAKLAVPYGAPKSNDAMSRFLQAHTPCASDDDTDPGDAA